jgi:DNA-binding XRE family transcriptional regulator
MKLGERLRAARQKRDMSLTDLARATGLSKGFISQVESGISNPSLASLHKFTESMGLPPGALLEETNGGMTSGEAYPYSSVVGSRDPETPGLTVFSLSSGGRSGIVPVTSGGNGGTAALLSLRPGTVLYGPASLRPVVDVASCAVLKGTIRLTQEGVTVAVGAGEVVTFGPNEIYSLTCGQGGPTSVFLSLPGGCHLPVRSDLDLQSAKIDSYPRTGPFRLVEMRAMRRVAPTARSRGD